MIAALSYKSISSHYSLRLLRLPFLTPIFFTTHIQSICKPHQSALKTSWTWPCTTTSFFQAIIFLPLGDYNTPYLVSLPLPITHPKAYSPHQPDDPSKASITSCHAFGSKLSNGFPTWSDSAYSSIIFFCSSPLFFCSSHTSSVHQLTKMISTSGPLHLLLAVKMFSLQASIWRPPSFHLRVLREAFPDHFHLFVLLNLFPFIFWHHTTYFFVYKYCLFLPTKSCSMRVGTLSVLVITGSHQTAWHVEGTRKRLAR